MGEPKVPLFLPFVAAAARPVFDQIIAVQRANGSAAAEIETIFEEQHSEHAPAFGVARALQHANADCFILAVDYPLIRSEVLSYIQSHAGDLILPRWNDKLQVLCGVYRKAVRAILEERLAAGRYDLRGLGDRARIIDEAELRARFAGEPLMNVNTREEWAEAKTLL